MAARRKTAQKSPQDLEGTTDPRAPLDSKKLLDAAKRVLALLADDLLKRAKASPTVTAALEARHAVEQAARRTADPFAVWQTNLVDQVAAAWLLSCVFVRTLEDRGLLGQARIAGPGAGDSQRQFLEMAPSLDVTTADVLYNHRVEAREVVRSFREATVEKGARLIKSSPARVAPEQCRAA